MASLIMESLQKIFGNISIYAQLNLLFLAVVVYNRRQEKRDMKGLKSNFWGRGTFFVKINLWGKSTLYISTPSPPHLRVSQG